MTPDDVHKLGYEQLNKLYPLVSKIEEYFNRGELRQYQWNCENTLEVASFLRLIPFFCLGKVPRKKVSIWD